MGLYAVAQTHFFQSDIFPVGYKGILGNVTRGADGGSDDIVIGDHSK